MEGGFCGTEMDGFEWTAEMSPFSDKAAFKHSFLYVWDLD